MSLNRHPCAKRKGVAFFLFWLLDWIDLNICDCLADWSVFNHDSGAMVRQRIQNNYKFKSLAFEFQSILHYGFLKIACNCIEQFVISAVCLAATSWPLLEHVELLNCSRKWDFQTDSASAGFFLVHHFLVNVILFLEYLVVLQPHLLLWLLPLLRRDPP
jgi:hypothetical protein